MENENEQAHDVEEQEETSIVDEGTDDLEETQEETVTIPKSKFVKMQRKAKSFDASKGNPTKTITTNSSDAKWKERMELRVDGHDESAVDFIMQNGGKKALQNPYVVKSLEAMKTQKQAEAAVIDDGSKSETEKRINQQDFKKLSSAEQLKVLSEQN